VDQFLRGKWEMLTSGVISHIQADMEHVVPTQTGVVYRVNVLQYIDAREEQVLVGVIV
jgi:hypothetical protein